jgi:hypothetical protein
VRGADAGIVIQEPFHQRSLVAALETARNSGLMARWSQAAGKYGSQGMLYEGKSRATELIIARGLQVTADQVGHGQQSG